MRDKFNRQLKQLYTEIKEMGEICVTVIEASAKTIINENDRQTYQGLYNMVAELEKEIDSRERDIENLCVHLLLHEQPVAGDLRIVSSAHRLISDMERIGDQAWDIAELSRYIRNCGINQKLNLSEMFSEAVSMVKKAVDAFAEKDLGMVRSVIAEDDRMDAIFVKMKKELIELVQKDVDAELCLDLLMVAKYLERIGDHATNIAGWVEYSVTGNH